MSSGREESELVAAAVAGDRAALAQALLLHYDDLRRHIERRLAGQTDQALAADDVLHQAMVRAAEAIARFRAAREGAFRAWLRTIADNLIRDAQRRRRRERRCTAGQGALRGSSASGARAALVEGAADDGTTPSMPARRRENADRLRDALGRLPGEQRAVLERYYLQDQSFDEIARALGVTRDAVRGMCYRGRKSLRNVLGRSSWYFSG